MYYSKNGWDEVKALVTEERLDAVIMVRNPVQAPVQNAALKVVRHPSQNSSQNVAS